MPTPNTADVTAAAFVLVEVLAPNWDMLSDTWQSLGCEEIEAVALLFRVTGHAGAAAAAVYDHAGADQEDSDDPVHLSLQGIGFEEARTILGY